MKIKVLLFLTLAFSGLTSSAQEALTLFQAIRYGLENNYSILIQENNAEITRNNNTVGNAGFLPTLDLDASQNNTINNVNQKPFYGDERNVTGATTRNFNAGLALNWTLFDGLSMFVNKDMLEVLEAQGATQLKLEVETTVSNIILTYYGVVQEKKVVQVLRDAADLSLQRKRIADAKISLGAGSRLMLLQSTVDLNADSTRLVQELSALENLKADLNRLMGRAPEIPFEVVDSINLDKRLTYEELLDRVAGQNTELLAARQDLELAGLDLRNQQALRYPKLSLGASYNFNQLNAEAGYLSYNRSYGPSFGLTLSYRIFDGLNVTRLVKNARVNLNTADYHFKDIDLAVRNDLYKYYNEYRTNLEIVRMERVNTEIARENVEVALEKYRLGTISDIDLREIQKKLIDAQYQLLLAEFQAKRAETELLRISGELNKMIP